MTRRASGTFDVTIKPLTSDADSPVGRMSLEKHLRGDLEATSQGQMLTAMTDIEGSAGYVAIERITGTLHGRNGSFVLQHNGSMTRATQQLSITVLPDSGTGQLTGLAGQMTITIDSGKHFYDFEYTLPETP